MQHHIVKAYTLLSGWITREAAIRLDTASLLLALGMNPRNWSKLTPCPTEILQMQAAAQQRLLLLQGSWSKDWIEWTQDCAQMNGANTMSKLIEQEFNLAGRPGELLKSQSIDLVKFLDSFGVNYAYWIAEKSRLL